MINNIRTISLLKLGKTSDKHNDHMRALVAHDKAWANHIEENNKRVRQNMQDNVYIANEYNKLEQEQDYITAMANEMHGYVDPMRYMQDMAFTKILAHMNSTLSIMASGTPVGIFDQHYVMPAYWARWLSDDDREELLWTLYERPNVDDSTY